MPPHKRSEFYAEIGEEKLDALLLGGDIGEADSLTQLLKSAHEPWPTNAVLAVSGTTPTAGAQPLHGPRDFFQSEVVLNDYWGTEQIEAWQVSHYRCSFCVSDPVSFR